MPTSYRFPTRKLKPRKATIAAHIHPSASGTALSFKIEIDFHPLDYAESEIEPSMGWDQLPVPGVRDWRELAGKRVRGSNPGRDGQPALEGTFLITSFNVAVTTDIKLSARKGACFELDAAMAVDFSWAHGDADPALPVRAKTEAVFTGLWIGPSGNKGWPKSLAAAQKLAREHVDLAVFAEPVARGKSFFFAPRPDLLGVAPAVESAPAPRLVKMAKRIRLANGLALDPVAAPAPRPPVAKPKLRVRIPGFVDGNDALLRTSAEGCFLAHLRSQGRLAVVDGGKVKAVDLPQAPVTFFSAWSSDFALYAADDALYQVALPGGAVSRVWRPPNDGVLFVPKTRFWARRLGQDRLVAWTPRHVFVLEPGVGKVDELARLEMNGFIDMTSADGRFILVQEASDHEQFIALGVGGRQVAELIRFKTTKSTRPHHDRLLFAGTGGFYELTGLDPIYARVFGGR